MAEEFPRYNSQEILDARGPKNRVDPQRPYACLVEQERAADGRIRNVGTVFLTNRECPFRCLMCDLWKNTTDVSITADQLESQIDFAVEKLGTLLQHGEKIHHLKLYNSGNFFDRQAIPGESFERLTRFVNDPPGDIFQLENLVIENHPRLVGAECIEFARSIAPRLEVAMGLETIHPAILQRLNKRMTLDDFRSATRTLRENSIAVRAFILLKPPFLDEPQGIHWALKSLEWAFQIGVQCCAVIPTRRGNGAIDQLGEEGWFSEPQLRSLEQVMDLGLRHSEPGGRLFVDLWDVDRFEACDHCRRDRVQRMERMNRMQAHVPHISCEKCTDNDPRSEHV